MQALVLCPTRELCLQVCRDLKGFARHLPGMRTTAVYGGAAIVTQIRALQAGTQVLVATPGRLHDLLRRGACDLSAATTVVLDEADEMLSMGFEEDLKAIMAAIPAHVRKLLFSATMPRSLAALVSAFVADPLEITIGTRGAGADTVAHHVYIVQEPDRYAALRRIVDAAPDIYGLVFCRTRTETQEVADALARDGYRADALHGDLSQVQRDRVMQAFGARQIRLLVATNVAARGLDIGNLTHVISFRLPDALEGYTHRSGRTGRAGRAGISAVLITPRECIRIPFIERTLGCRFVLQSVPDGRAVCAARLAAHLAQARADTDAAARIAPFMPAILEQLDGLTREEIVTCLLAGQFRELLEHYRDAADLNAPAPPRRSAPHRPSPHRPPPHRPTAQAHPPRGPRPVAAPAAAGVPPPHRRPPPHATDRPPHPRPPVRAAAPAGTPHAHPPRPGSVPAQRAQAQGRPPHAPHHKPPRERKPDNTPDWVKALKQPGKPRKPRKPSR